MDLTWDDTSDHWYGDLDQRHLYFGLTDELMAIAHSDHTANYQKNDYAYRSTDLSNNYFVQTVKQRNGRRSMPIAFSSTWMPRKRAFPLTPTTSPSHQASQGFRTGLLRTR